MKKLVAAAFAPLLFAPGLAHAVSCRAVTGETFIAASAPVGAMAAADCLQTAADPVKPRPLSPLLQLYEAPGASLDVHLKPPRGSRPSIPRSAAPRVAAPPSATITLPAAPARRDLRPTPPGARPGADVLKARTGGRAPRGLEHAWAIYSTARAYDIDPALMGALARKESGLNARARSPKGALGLMQVMPATGARFGARGAALSDPAVNLAVGARYLKTLQRRYGNNLPLILAAYNAGEGAVDRHGRRIPPYRETQGYVTGVLGDYGGALRRRSVQR